MNDAATTQDLLARAMALGNAGRLAEASAAFVEIHQRFAGSTDPAVRLDLARAMLNIGVILKGTGEPAAAVGAFDRVIREYPEDIPSVATALHSKGGALMAEGRLGEAAEAYTEFIRRFGDLTAQGYADAIASALSNRGIVLAGQGRPDAAVASLDEVVRRFGDSADARLLDRVAGALYNKGIVLRDAGRAGEALAAFTEAVERFADSPAAGPRRWAAMALYNRAITLAKGGDVAGSVTSAEEMVRRFNDSDDPAVRERLAKALYNRALILRHEGMLKEAVEAFWDIEGRFARDRGPVVQSVVAAARRYGLFILAGVNPVGHAWANIFTQTTFREFEQDVQEALPEDKEVSAERLAHYQGLVKDLVRQDVETHQQAARVLVKYLDEGEPFGLFLRNFEIEGFLRMGATGAGPVRASVQLPRAGVVEQYIAQAFGERVPFLGISNNAPTLPGDERHIPKLELPNERWQEVVEELVRAAEIIVANVERLTPGVLFELDTIRRLGRLEQTVVVISEPDELMSALPRVLIDAPAPEAPKASHDSAPLAPFRRVAYAADLPARPEDSPIFSDLLGRIDGIRRLGLAERMRWDGITF